jgi:hypothetical protein
MLKELEILSVSLDLVLYLAFRLSSASFTLRDIKFHRIGHVL